MAGPPRPVCVQPCGRYTRGLVLWQVRGSPRTGGVMRQVEFQLPRSPQQCPRVTRSSDKQLDTQCEGRSFSTVTRGPANGTTFSVPIFSKL